MAVFSRRPELWTLRRCVLPFFADIVISSCPRDAVRASLLRAPPASLEPDLDGIVDQVQVRALPHEPYLHNHAFVVAQDHSAIEARPRRSWTTQGEIPLSDCVRAGEVLELAQVVYIPFDRGVADAEVGEAQVLDRERVVFASKSQCAVTPCDPRADRD